MATPDVFEDSSSGTEEDFLLAEYCQLKYDFEQAALHAQNLVHLATTDQLLYLYARYKQVKVGKCTTSKPGFFDYEGRQKWDAWKSLGDYCPKRAMREYIQIVKQLDPDWTPKRHFRIQLQTEEFFYFTIPSFSTLVSKVFCPSGQEFFEEPIQDLKARFGGPVVSCLYQEEEILRDEDKDIFDYCRENDITRISQLLATGAIDVDVADEEGRSLLHWACDRGRTELVSLLLFHNAHINIKDDEGQTPLHYAAACEFADIVHLLLEHSADPTLMDKDGFQPHEVTDNKDISDTLKQHVTFREHDKPPSLKK